MSKKLLALLLLALVAELLAVEVEDGGAEQRQCVSGRSYFDGCNMCSCMGNGAIGCTLKACQIYNAKTGTFEMAETIPAPDDFWEH